MACAHPERVTAIATLAGAAYGTGIDSLGGTCAPSLPVSALMIHGTADATILYGGGLLGGQPYPGADDTVAHWRALNSCDSVPTQDKSLADYVGSLPGPETQRSTWACAQGTEVSLWKMLHAGHLPVVNDIYRDAALLWLLGQQRPAP